MRPLYLLALAAAAAALQFSPVKPLRRRALQRRIRREADFISSPARGMDPEVLIQDDDALDDLVQKAQQPRRGAQELDAPAAALHRRRRRAERPPRAHPQSRAAQGGEQVRRCLQPRRLLPKAVPLCVEIKILRRVRAQSSRRPPRHRRDACSMAWRCRFLAA